MTMKQIIDTFAIIAAIIALAACHRDLGNYDYTTEPNAIEISDSMNTNHANKALRAFVFELGEDVVIPAKYKIIDKTLTKDKLMFEWFFGGNNQPVATGEVLTLKDVPVGLYDALLVITDLRYDQKYSKTVSYSVNPSFTEGWAFISEDGSSNSKLNYLRINPNNRDEYELREDVFASSNDGAKLSSGVKELVAHTFSEDKFTFAISIVQPGDIGPIDISANSMSVIGKIKKEFLSDASSLDIKSVIYKKDQTYVLSENGELYIRDDENVNHAMVPHSGRFTNTPIAVAGGMHLQDWVNCSAFSTMMVTIPGIVGYDSDNHRCVDIMGYRVRPFADSKEFYSNQNELHRDAFGAFGPGFDGTKEYPEIKYPGPENLSGYKVVKMKGCGFDIGWGATQYLTIVMLLQKESDKKLYLYTFDCYYDAWSGLQDIDLGLFFPVEGKADIDPANIIMINNMGGPRHGVFFTGSDTKSIYYFDAIRGLIRKIYTSDSPITGIRAGEVANWMGASPYADLFVVATEDGYVKVLKVDDDVIAGAAPEVKYSVKINGGHATMIEYLPNNAYSF